MEVFKICDNCHCEFQLPFQVNNGKDFAYTIETCPHCKGRNSIWIRIDVKPTRFQLEERVNKLEEEMMKKSDRNHIHFGPDTVIGRC